MITRVLLFAVVAGTLACQTTSTPSGFGPEAERTTAAAKRDRPAAAPKSTGTLRTIYFEYDQASLRGDAREQLRHNAQLLRKRPKLSLEIQGHADERGSSEYNLALGKRRAEAAKRFLVDMGIEPGRLATTSYGEEYPAVRGHDERAWSKNRRGVFVVR